MKLPPVLQYHIVAYFHLSGCPIIALSPSTIKPKKLKQLMNCWKEPLRELGLSSRSYRSNGQRLVKVWEAAVGGVWAFPGTGRAVTPPGRK